MTCSCDVNVLMILIFLVFFVFSSVRNLQKCEEAMKFQGPFNVTHKGKTVIFIAT